MTKPTAMPASRSYAYRRGVMPAEPGLLDIEQLRPAVHEPGENPFSRRLQSDAKLQAPAGNCLKYTSTIFFSASFVGRWSAVSTVSQSSLADMARAAAFEK